jgi:undecaprenyl pyrophosphate phosphatase UppP
MLGTFRLQITIRIIFVYLLDMGVPLERWLREAGRSFLEVMIILFVFGILLLESANGSSRVILKRVRR